MMKWYVKADSFNGDDGMGWTVEADSPEEAYRKGYDIARKNEFTDLGSVEVEVLEEDRQLICDRLLGALRLTQRLQKLVELRYRQDRQEVVAGFETGHTRTVNVAGDSGAAMVEDIISKLL